MCTYRYIYVCVYKYLYIYIYIYIYMYLYLNPQMQTGGGQGDHSERVRVSARVPKIPGRRSALPLPFHVLHTAGVGAASNWLEGLTECWPPYWISAVKLYANQSQLNHPEGVRGATRIPQILSWISTGPRWVSGPIWVSACPVAWTGHVQYVHYNFWYLRVWFDHISMYICICICRVDRRVY